MILRGEYRDSSKAYGVMLSKNKIDIEIILVEAGQVVQAFKRDSTGEYSFANVVAKNLDKLLQTGLKGCNSKNGQPIPFIYGTSMFHEFVKTKNEYAFEKFNDELVAAEIRTNGDAEFLQIKFSEDIQNFQFPQIPYTKLTVSNRSRKKKDEKDIAIADELDNVQVRTVAEIALEKEDVTWLKGKKYYIINDDAQAEALFKQLDNYNGPIAFDTETTGLKINCFGKINSVYQRSLEKYNAEHPDEKIRADKLVGIIFCVQEDVSYYFPAFNRKFKNLYQDLDSEVRRKTIENIKARYTVGDLRDQHDDDMYNYVINTPAEKFTSDIILMERVRNILEKGHIVGHNGTFDWKVAYLYGIDTNFKDDTMIMHQLMYKFRSTTSNRGESSALKYLEKREFGMDAWELEDFFPDYKEDNSGLTKATKRSKKGSLIDFSYMDYDGTRIYAPTDGDATFKLFVKYKSDMIENHKDLEYLYQVEMLVSSAVAYMEFYGHRLDERMIEGARVSTQADVLRIESEIRQVVQYSSPEEIQAYQNVLDILGEYKDADKNENMDKSKYTIERLEIANKRLREIIDNDEDHPLNLASPAQVATLFYDVLQIPNPGDKKSVAKRELKALLKEKNSDGSPKYPIVHLYSEYKKQDTLVTKFFDNLQYFMYPGGYIFSHFGQIAAATGRMSASKPNRATRS